MLRGLALLCGAPNAKRVSVVGEFNFWDGRRHPMRLRRENGIWELFLPGVQAGQLYKFEIIDCNEQVRLKADPYAFEAQMRPETASLISPLPDVVANPRRQRPMTYAPRYLSMKCILAHWRRHTENNFWLSYTAN